LSGKWPDVCGREHGVSVDVREARVDESWDWNGVMGGGVLSMKLLFGLGRLSFFFWVGGGGRRWVIGFHMSCLV
jgi:hypothetical protein